MVQTVVVKVSGRTLEALREGKSVMVRLDRSNVVGGLVRKAGRKPGRNSNRQALWWHVGGRPRPGSVPAQLLLWAIENGGKVDSRDARRVLRRSRVYSSGILSQLAAAGLLRRVHWGRYEVTAKGRTAEKALSDIGRYRKGSHRERLLEWATRIWRPFEVAEAARFLGVSHVNLQVTLGRLIKDGLLVRESLGVYRVN